MRRLKSSSELMTVIEERNKNRHPPRIAKNGSDHRRGAVTREKKTRAHQDHIPGSPVLVQSSVLSSILIVLCHTEVYIWLPSHISENLIPEADLCSDWFLLLTNCCGSDSAICCQFTMYYLAPVPYWGRLDGLCWKPSRVSCWERLGFVLQKLDMRTDYHICIPS
jgi:hypothetical protein